MTMLRSTRMSAPGKVLLVGGYLVLDEQYSGLVLSSTARFYSQVTSSANKEEDDAQYPSDWRRLFPLMVESKQFDQIIDGWIEESEGGRIRFQLREKSDRNAYIEETVLCALNGIAGLDQVKKNDTFKLLQETREGVRVELRGDNDFYSQVQRLQAAKTSLCRENLRALEKFLPPTMEERVEGKMVALKTGMGSSAALVTSLVAALVAFFVPAIDLNERKEDLELVHNLAQLSHCYVQRKIGSGFDVSAACFGSQRYTRFPASILNTFTTEQSLLPEDIAKCITDRRLWNTSSRVNRFKLPSSFHLMMGDISSGSATVSMVRKVLKWKEDQSEQALAVMSALHAHNMEVERGFAKLCKLEDNSELSTNWEILATQTHEQWVSSNPVIGPVLVEIYTAFSQVRTHLREMGAAAGVPIEPPEQTMILDATLALPGVLTAGVPGAGGYDAICVVVLHESVVDAVEDLWVQWPSKHPDSIICPLLCDVDRGLAGASAGLQLHSID